MRGDPRGPQGGGLMAAALQEQLGIDQAKAEAVAKALEARATAMRDMFRQRLGRDEIRTRMEELRKQTDEDLAKLLTPEQLEQLGGMMPQRWPRDGNRGGNRGGGRGRSRGSEGGNNQGGGDAGDEPERF